MPEPPIPTRWIRAEGRLALRDSREHGAGKDAGFEGGVEAEIDTAAVYRSTPAHPLRSSVEVARTSTREAPEPRPYNPPPHE